MARTPTSRSTLAFIEPQSRAAGARAGRRSVSRRSCSSRCCSWKRPACTWRAPARWPPGARHRAWEAGLLTVHAAGYFPVVFLLLSPDQGSCVHPGAAGPVGPYLGVSFASNHKGMPILDATNRSGFLRRQVLTSRNVRGGWLTDLGLGGLN